MIRASFGKAVSAFGPRWSVWSVSCVAVAIAAPVVAEDWRTFLKFPERAADKARCDAMLCAVAPVLGEAEEEPVPTEPAVEKPDDAITLAQVSPDTASATTAAEAKDPDDGPASQEPCVEERGDCREALERLRADAIAGIDLDIRVGGRPGNDYPCECRLEGETFEPRRFATTMFTWKAAGYCHKPLYFEDWELERYGHSRGPLADPFLSAAHFFITLPILPYKMGVELPWECVYPLGYYRPGSCAPWTIPAIPISCRGMAVQAATVTGLVFLLP
ncbi:MAG: hypothetical protein K8S94_05330 [Planctomycetia bacterium]|nr:hypothetical protein [Planctomycetia bacterium]